jgi:DNA-binding CsgD family transcriptional regulator
VQFVDEELLRLAFGSLRKQAAPGVDGQSYEDYAAGLDENLWDLYRRLKSGRYRAPALRRVSIPKANGKLRPLGITTIEDRVVQKAVAWVLSAVFEQDFLECSQGFRPKRSAHMALRRLRDGMLQHWVRYVVEVDVSNSLELQYAGGEHWTLAQSLDMGATIAAAQGKAERAFQLVGAADRVYKRLGRQRPDVATPGNWQGPLRDALGADATEAALAHGRSLTLADTIALAVREEPSAHPEAKAAAGPAGTPLTAREREVVALLADGLTNRQIAAQLVITERTVAAHVEHILAKLGFASRHQVAVWAHDHRQIDLG